MVRFRSLVLGCSLVLVAGAALAACSSGVTPTLIASYPKVIATYAPPRDVFVVYTSDLDLEVGSVDSAARRAAEIAGNFGGYLTEASLWSSGGRPQATVTLAIPVGFYEDARKAVSALGTPTGERLTGSLTVAYGDAARWNTFAHLTLHLSETAPRLPTTSWPTIGWSPAQTLGQAIGFSAALFTVLLNIVIWVVVVLGPFVLLGLGVRWVVRQVRKQGP
jgi:hypothetical protein